MKKILILLMMVVSFGNAKSSCDIYLAQAAKYTAKANAVLSSNRKMGIMYTRESLLRMIDARYSCPSNVSALLDKNISQVKAMLEKYDK